MVKQIRIIAVLLIIQGAFEIIPGGLLTAAALAAGTGGEFRAGILPGELSFVMFLLGPILLGGGIFKVLAVSESARYLAKDA